MPPFAALKNNTIAFSLRQAQPKKKKQRIMFFKIKFCKNQNEHIFKNASENMTFHVEIFFFLLKYFGWNWQEGYFPNDISTWDSI